MVSRNSCVSISFFFVRAITFSKSVLYFAFMNFDASYEEFFLLVSALRKVLSDNFSLPIKSISAIFIFHLYNNHIYGLTVAVSGTTLMFTFVL
jgi:hypothetical protein